MSTHIPSEEQRVAEYAICKRRGHQSDGRQYTSNPPMQRCKWCGVYYRYAERLVESAAP